MGRMKIHGGRRRTIVTTAEPPQGIDALLKVGAHCYVYDEEAGRDRIAIVTHRCLHVVFLPEAHEQADEENQNGRNPPVIRDIDTETLRACHVVRSYDYRCTFVPGEQATLFDHGDIVSVTAANLSRFGEHLLGESPESVLDHILPKTIPIDILEACFVSAAYYGKPTILSFLHHSRNVHPFCEVRDGTYALSLVAGKRCKDEGAAARTLDWFIDLHKGMPHTREPDDGTFDHYCMAWQNEKLQRQLQNIFHEAAIADNAAFLIRLFSEGSTAPDYSKQLEDGTFVNSEGNFEGTFRYRYTPRTLGESLVSWKLIEERDEHGRKPPDLTLPVIIRRTFLVGALSNRHSKHLWLLAGFEGPRQIIADFVGIISSKENPTCQALRLFTEHYGRRELSGALRAFFRNKRAPRVSRIIATKRYGLSRDSAREIVLKEPHTILLAAGYFGPYCLHCPDFELLKWLVDLTDLDVETPLSDLVDFRGYNFPSLKSIAQVAMVGVRCCASRETVTQKQCAKEEYFHKRMIAVMMGTHPRLGKDSPLSKLPHRLVHRIALMGREHQESLSWSKVSSSILEMQANFLKLPSDGRPRSDEMAAYEGASYYEARLHLGLLGLPSLSWDLENEKRSELLDILQWLVFEKGVQFEPCEWRWCWQDFAEQHDTKGLQWLIDMGFLEALDDERAMHIIRLASRTGSIKLMKWVLWDAKPLPYLARSPLLHSAMIRSIRNGHHHLVRYLDLTGRVSLASLTDDGEMIAVMMAKHPRLGCESPLRSVPPRALQTVAEMVGRCSANPAHIFLQHCASKSGLVPKFSRQFYAQHLAYYMSGGSVDQTEESAKERSSMRELERSMKDKKKKIADNKDKDEEIKEEEEEDDQAPESLFREIPAYLDPSQMTDEWDLKDSKGRTTLWHAANCGNLHIMACAKRILFLRRQSLALEEARNLIMQGNLDLLKERLGEEGARIFTCELKRQLTSYFYHSNVRNIFRKYPALEAMAVVGITDPNFGMIMTAILRLVCSKLMCSRCVPFSVEIPKDAVPGQHCTCWAPDGRRVKYEVPSNVTPGKVLQLMLPASDHHTTDFQFTCLERIKDSEDYAKFIRCLELIDTAIHSNQLHILDWIVEAVDHASERHLSWKLFHVFPSSIFLGRRNCNTPQSFAELAQSDKATSKEVRVWLTDQERRVAAYYRSHLLYERTGLQCSFQLRALRNSDSPPARPPLSQFQDALQELVKSANDSQQSACVRQEFQSSMSLALSFNKFSQLIMARDWQALALMRTYIKRYSRPSCKRDKSDYQEYDEIVRNIFQFGKPELICGLADDLGLSFNEVEHRVVLLRSLKYWRRSEALPRCGLPTLRYCLETIPPTLLEKEISAYSLFEDFFGLFRRIKVASVENILYTAVLRGITIHSGAAIFGWDDPFRKIETVLNESKLEAAFEAARKNYISDPQAFACAAMKALKKLKALFEALLEIVEMLFQKSIFWIFKKHSEKIDTYGATEGGSAWRQRIQWELAQTLDRAVLRPLGPYLFEYESHVNWLFDSFQIDHFPRYLDYLTPTMLGDDDDVYLVDELHLQGAIKAFHQKRARRRRDADMFVEAIRDEKSIDELKRLLPNVDGFTLSSGRHRLEAKTSQSNNGGILMSGADYFEMSVRCDRADILEWLSSEVPASLHIDWRGRLCKLAEQYDAKKVAALLDTPLLETIQFKQAALSSLRPLAQRFRRRRRETGGDFSKRGSSGSSERRLMKEYKVDRTYAADSPSRCLEEAACYVHGICLASRQTSASSLQASSPLIMMKYTIGGLDDRPAFLRQRVFDYVNKQPSTR